MSPIIALALADKIFVVTFRMRRCYVRKARSDSFIQSFIAYRNVG